MAFGWILRAKSISTSKSFQQASLLEEGIPGRITDFSNKAAEELWKNIVHYSATYQVWELGIEVKATKVGSFQIVEKLSNNPGKSLSCVLQGANMSDIK